MTQIADSKSITGQRFGRLLVVRPTGVTDRHGRTQWECVCDCGSTKLAWRGPLVAGDCQSCGCLRSSSPRMHWKRHRSSVYDRFKQKVDRSGGPDACWPWTAARNPDGYGMLRVPLESGGWRMAMAHKLALEFSGVKIPDGKFALHTCDNPPCCNPKHLYVGDHEQNMRDMVARGRASHHGFTGPLGEGRYNACLTNEIVRAARARARNGESPSAIARTVGVNVHTLWNAIRGRTWAHI